MGEGVDVVDTESERSVGRSFEKYVVLPAEKQLNWLCGVLSATLWW